MLTDPARCVQIATAFLERTASNPKADHQQSPGVRLSGAHAELRLRHPDHGAYLLKGECLQQLGQFKPAQESFAKGIAMAEKEQQFELHAHGLYLQIRSQTLQLHAHEHRTPPSSDKLDKLLASPAQRAQLQVYARLLHVNASMEERQFDLAKRQLAEARQWAEQAKNPLARAWTSAVGAISIRPWPAPARPRGVYRCPAAGRGICRIPVPRTALQPDGQPLSGGTGATEGAAIRQRGGQLLPCPRQPSLLSDAPDRAMPVSTAIWGR